jgi:hypothetical protein
MSELRRRQQVGVHFFLDEEEREGLKAEAAALGLGSMQALFDFRMLGKEDAARRPTQPKDRQPELPLTG